MRQSKQILIVNCKLLIINFKKNRISILAINYSTNHN